MGLPVDQSRARLPVNGQVGRVGADETSSRQGDEAMATSNQTRADKRNGGASPKTRAEPYEIARKRDLPGRSKMNRGELAGKVGESQRTGT